MLSLSLLCPEQGWILVRDATHTHIPPQASNSLAQQIGEPISCLRLFAILVRMSVQVALSERFQSILAPFDPVGGAIIGEFQKTTIDFLRTIIEIICNDDKSEY